MVNNLLAIDPGTNKLGIALFQDGKLIQTETITTKSKERYERTIDICGGLMTALDKAPVGFDYNIADSMTVVCEEPMMQGKANTAMQRLLGALEFLMSPRMNYIHPMTMKKVIKSKTADKEDVKTAVIKLVSDSEVAKHEALFLSQRYDEIDAVGIGLAYMIQNKLIEVKTAKPKKKKKVS